MISARSAPPLSILSLARFDFPIPNSQFRHPILLQNKKFRSVGNIFQIKIAPRGDYHRSEMSIKFETGAAGKKCTGAIEFRCWLARGLLERLRVREEGCILVRSGASRHLFSELAI
jgi:hypothetical protein